MPDLIKDLFLFACFLFIAGAAQAETDSNSQTIIEMAEVTIRMTNNNPYAEFRQCNECPSRLLPLSPTAQVYLNGQNTATNAFQNGQKIRGTIFIQSRPTESIREIVAK